MSRIECVRQIVEHRLCLGCGACAYICPEHVKMVDVASEGFRPVVAAHAAKCAACAECLSVCPGFENDHTKINNRPGIVKELREFCGPVLEIWEGYATDEEIRFAGASGGAITALSLFCMQERGMFGTLHIGADPNDPTRNRTTMSTTRAELLGQTGSRYAAASACDRLGLIESSSAPCVFVGQPSEATALRKACEIRPRLSRNVGLVISFFCAGSPSRQGTLDLLKRMGLNENQVEDLRYRGKGWPGMFVPQARAGVPSVAPISYHESWGFVQAYRPFSTHLSPDGTGEDADISCGDPWYREVRPNDAGQSMVVVRTEMGREIIRAAMAANYLTLAPSEPWKLLKSQQNLLAKRGAVGGRIAALKTLGLASPRLLGFALFKNWRRLSWREKIRSTLGTIRRVFQRGYYRPLKF